MRARTGYVADGSQLDNGGGVGVSVTVVCSTESRDAEWLLARNRVTASRSKSLLPRLPPSKPRLPANLSTPWWALCELAPVPGPPPPPFEAFAPLPAPGAVAACAPLPPTPTLGHFWRPFFFFLRLKKQQHLESKQILIDTLRQFCQFAEWRQPEAAKRYFFLLEIWVSHFDYYRRQERQFSQGYYKLGNESCKESYKMVYR